METLDCILKKINNNNVSLENAVRLLAVENDTEIDTLLSSAQQTFKRYHAARADLCTLVNAKSGRCGEDCSFCAQSAHWNTDVENYALKKVEQMVDAAIRAEASGAGRFCIVTSGGQLSDNDFEQVLEAYKRIKKQTALALDGSLGFLNDARIEKLINVGVTRINHNLETSREYFPSICSTHSFEERYQTVKRLKEAGFEVCCGGIIGLGETRNDRISLAFSLKELNVDCVPINILNPRPGTPLSNSNRLPHCEIIKTVAVFRLLLPKAVIKIAGGRETGLGEAQEQALRAGANGIIIGGYLTTTGNPVDKDLDLIRRAGLEV